MASITPYLEFLPGAPDPALAYLGYYSPWLVLLSVLIAIFASYAALYVADQIKSAAGAVESTGWLVVGALAMGGGIWSMHFVGMLAFQLPCVVHYDASATLVSMIPSIIASGLALTVISRPEVSAARLLGGGVLLGVGIGAMHHGGMAAMRMNALLRYEPRLFALSIVVAVVFSVLALWIRFGLERFVKRQQWTYIASATVMGMAISGMHYTAMASAYFIRSGETGGGDVALDPALMAMAVVTVTILVIGVAIIAACANRYVRMAKELEGAKRTLDDEHAFLDRIINAVADPIFVKDRQGRFVLVNEAYCGFFHRRREDLIGGTGGDSGFDEDADVFKALGEGSLDAGPAEAREGVYMTADGAHHHIQISATPCFRADGRRFVVGVVRDITQQRHAVERIEEAQQAAESASEMKSQFLANMSHEIRSPMNGIIGIAELLADTPLDHEQHGYVQTIERSAQTLLGIINDILDFSKIEAGKVSLERIGFDPAALAENCAAMAAPRAYEKSLSLVSYVGSDVPPQLLGDPTRLTQILVNFLTNAVKFTSQGEVLLRVARIAAADDAITLRFSVSDTGIGISSRQLDRLFTPFMQADASTTRRYGGTGLGLTICKRLAELMGGGIGVDSREGHGSTFWVELPFPLAASDKQPPVPPTVTAGEVILVGGGRALRECLRGYLGHWGARVKEAATLEEALESLAGGGGRELLVLMEHHFAMAVRKQVEAASASRRLDIALLLAAPDEEAAAVARALGMRVLVQPATRRSLAELLAPAPAAAAPAAAAVAEAQPHASAAALDAGRLILVAEDNPVNQIVAVSVLKKLGYSAHVVSNGREAVDALARLAYGLVFMDIQMPVMDGFEATRAIRQAEAGGGHIPIVAMTANAMAGDRERCLSMGMDDYISKPITVAGVKDILDAWLLDGGGAAKPSPSAAVGGPVLDRARLHDFLGDDDAAIREALEVFVDSIPQRADGLRQALEAKDGERLALLLKDFHVSSESFGALRLAQLLNVMQAYAEQGQWASLFDAMAQLEEQRLALMALTRQS